MRDFVGCNCPRFVDSKLGGRFGEEPCFCHIVCFLEIRPFSSFQTEKLRSSSINSDFSAFRSACPLKKPFTYCAFMRYDNYAMEPLVFTKQVLSTLDVFRFAQPHTHLEWSYFEACAFPVGFSRVHCGWKAGPADGTTLVQRPQNLLF